ncbi:winged helix-turn-helix domain-containing protein [Flavobacterium sp.]|uniref:winged helix-turn-helix domain-containing protein n=1 Tax=Flavobacterium sp. TaxID=239 RepID=UPI0026249030|nr:winged helix-turn-helix domain-containing protein [Flavobacterium sp.]
MHLSRHHLFATRHHALALLCLSVLLFVCAAFTIGDDGGFAGARREILLRRVGHELLLQSGDSTSRVLPVATVSDQEYEIRFENELTFRPDLLVNTTRRVLAKDPQGSDYVVNVMRCGSDSVVYGFAVSQDKKDDIVSCIGRVQPRACYVVRIRFRTAGMDLAKQGLLLGSLSLLAFGGLVISRSVKRRKSLSKSPPENTFTLGSLSFDAKNRTLTGPDTTIDLTATETRVLQIFASSPNETIARSRLQKEIWEDEGVIVGRSLDMFISKLRKKLESDPNIKIVVVRGKGYRLETGA